MIWTRRGFLSVLSGSVVGRAASSAGADRSPFPAARIEPFPATPLVGPFLDSIEGRGAPHAEPTRDEYVGLIHGIVRVFARHQDARGAIIDPFEHAERQYSTPAFALAGAVVCASGRDPALLPQVVRAMQSACADLVAGKAADGHADFFTVLLIHADSVLEPLVTASVAGAWRRDLAALVPEQVYVHQPWSGKPLGNWNLVAAAGEWLRSRAGYARSDAWWRASLARQAEHVTTAGMYRDPNDPMAYDHFARLWALDILAEGCTDPVAQPWGEWIEKGAWASLFMQSPRGELPCGGRSAHHQWNEAEQAVTFETVARRYWAAGHAAAAGVFKRAARLSAESIRRSVRPTGELWIVKNRVEPSARHGYETYSFHSQYNLLTAAMLAMAWLRADDAVPALPSPAEVGVHAFAVQPAFHKVFAAAGGWYVEVDTAADPHYNPTGILRVHHPLAPAAISDGTVTSPAYQLPSKPTSALALGPEWRGTDGGWVSLAAHGRDELEPPDVRVTRAPGGRAVAEIRYRGRLRGGATAVRETIVVSEGGVEVTHAVEGGVTAVREVVPVLVSDGESEASVSLQGATVVVGFGGQSLRVSASQGMAWKRSGVREPCRNGFLEAMKVDAAGPTVGCRIEGPGRRP